MANLTVDEARVRARIITVQAYDVALDLDTGTQTFDSNTTIRFEAATDAETFVDLNAAEIHEVTLDGTRLDARSCVDGRLPLRLSAGPHELTAHATMAYSNDGEGMHRAVDPVDDEAYLHAMSFLNAAPRIFCCFDQPDLKAPYTMAVRAPRHWTVVGNARAERGGDGVWRFHETRPLSTYFVTLVAGPYHVLTREHDGIRLGLLARQSLAPHLDKDADELFTVTAQCFDAYHELFGIRYPFGDYYQCFVPEFNAGAMENPGCVTFRDDMIFRSRVTGVERGGRARVIAHEMAHQWFGDLVTMRWWDDLWLNESFAEYMAYRVCDTATEFTDSWVDFAGVRKPWGLRADQRPSTHPVAGNGAADGASALADFDGISYAKGASVLKQLAAYLGDDVFLGGVRDHLTRHAYGNATLYDLFDAWRRAGATDLDQWAQAWLRTAGADIIRSDRTTLTVDSPDGTVRSHTFSIGVVDDDRAISTRRISLDGAPVRLEQGADAALLLLDVHDETWARFRHDSQTVAALSDSWPRITDPVTRASLWLGLRDAVDDADLDVDHAVALVAAAVPHETEDITLQSLATWSERALLNRYLVDAAPARARLGAAYERRLESATPGSTLQLAAARGLITLTDDTTALHRWMDGGAPEGLAIDDELRWQIVTRLARWGAIDAAAIAREVERDPSSSGRLHATRALTALPDADTKAAAWRDLTDDTGRSNYLLYATAEGFWWPEQAALHEQYVDRYFTEIPATQEFRSGWVVGEVAKLAFPSVAVDDRTRGLAVAMLARDDLAPGLRRSVADQAADLTSALRVRQAQVS